MSNKEVIVYTEATPEGCQKVIMNLCPEKFELRFLHPGDIGIQGAIEDADYLISPIFKVTKEVIDKAKKLKLVHCPGAGVNNVDLEYAKEKGIYVCNSPAQNATTTAEMAIALMLCCLRRVCQVDRLVKQGEWHSWTYRHDSYELLGKTVGVIGSGAVGKMVMKRLQGFDVNILYSDPYRMSPELENEYKATYVTMEELLRQSDVVSLNCPLLPSTRGLIGREQFAMMKPNAIIVNESRGAVIDHEALVEALEQGKIWGAAIDCWWQEPMSPDDPLLKMDKVVTTSHIGASSKETMERVFSVAFNNAVLISEGNNPNNIVNGL